MFAAKKEKEGQRYAGALVLRELAEHAPRVLYERRSKFFEIVWPVIFDAAVSGRFERGREGSREENPAADSSYPPLPTYLQ